MNFLSTKSTISILLAASFMGLGNASASTVDFTDNGWYSDQGTSFSEVVDGVNITISAYIFADNTTAPSSATATATIMQAYSNHGIGIGPDNTGHTANNVGSRELFLIEFDKSVSLTTASISEWGNTNRRLGGDSDVDYWAGSNEFSFDNLGTRFNDTISSHDLFNAETRSVEFDSSLDNINWLVFGPEKFNSTISSLGVHDYIKLRNIEFNVAQAPAPVPLPAPILLLSSALISLAGFKRKANIS